MEGGRGREGGLRSALRGSGPGCVATGQAKSTVGALLLYNGTVLEGEERSMLHRGWIVVR